MAIYAKLVQRTLNYAEGSNVVFDIAYGVVDSTGLTVFPNVVAVAVPMATPGTWEDSFKDAVVANANANGYALTLANLKWDISEPADYRYPQLVAGWTKDITKTNLPATYTNIYIGSGGEGQLFDATPFKQYRFTVFVNKVGTGTQTAALVDVANAANLIELADAAAAGEHSLDSGWVNKPAWMTGEVLIKPMGKSTVTTDDPIYRGFALYLR
jgi:hypothetical protein